MNKISHPFYVKIETLETCFDSPHNHENPFTNTGDGLLLSFNDIHKRMIDIFMLKKVEKTGKNNEIYHVAKGECDPQIR